MNMEESFYMLEERPVHQPLGVGVAGVVDPFAVLRGDTPLEEPVQCHHARGSRLYDIVWTTQPPMRLLSKVCLNAFVECSCTGFRTLSAAIHHRKFGLLDSYSLLVVAGRAGSIQYDKARVERRPPIIPGAPERRIGVGVNFDYTTWDGSDLFLLGSSGYIAVSPRVRHALRRTPLSNLMLTPLQDVEIPFIELNTKIARRENTSGGSDRQL